MPAMLVPPLLLRLLQLLVLVVVMLPPLQPVMPFSKAIVLSATL